MDPEELIRRGKYLMEKIVNCINESNEVPSIILSSLSQILCNSMAHYKIEKKDAEELLKLVKEKYIELCDEENNA